MRNHYIRVIIGFLALPFIIILLGSLIEAVLPQP